MDGRSPNHHTVYQFTFFLVPGVLQVSDLHTVGNPRDVKENMISQTRPPSSIIVASSHGEVSIVDAFGGGQGPLQGPH